MQFNRCRGARLALFAMLLVSTTTAANGQIKKTAKTAPQQDPVEAKLLARLEALEVQLEAARGELPKRDAAPARYQMLKAGERVVILDTQTGKTQIIDPEPQTTLQKVDVGRAWVVVTVLGNASSSTRTKPPIPALPED